MPKKDRPVVAQGMNEPPWMTEWKKKESYHMAKGFIFFASICIGVVLLILFFYTQMAKGEPHYWETVPSALDQVCMQDGLLLAPWDVQVIRGRLHFRCVNQKLYDAGVKANPGPYPHLPQNVMRKFCNGGRPMKTEEPPWFWCGDKSGGHEA